MVRKSGQKKSGQKNTGHISNFKNAGKLQRVGPDMKEREREMNKQYESLYQRSKDQDRTKVFAYFNFEKVNPSNGRKEFDPWLPYRPLSDLAQVDGEMWASFEKKEGDYKFPEDNLETLASYLNSTFMRLQEEGKILYSADNDRACFNTGLLDRRYCGDIYAFFDRNRNGSENQDWFFRQFATQSVSIRRKLLEGFAGLPEVAEYYNTENYHDLFFNLEYKTIIVSEHIVEDNTERLPHMLRNDPHVAYTVIKGAIDKLYAKIRRNYKLAVPHWHNGHIQLFLPLFLANPTKPDLALLVERLDEQKCYLGKTILTLDMAYKAARLICRPDSDWLNYTMA